MIQVKNVSGTDRAVQPAEGEPFHVAAGETVEVANDLGKSLLQQPDNWASVKTAAKKES